jgi:hypothetical protein
MPDEKLPDARGAVPQLGPIRQVQLVPLAAVPAPFLAAVLLLGNLIQYAIRILDARELEVRVTKAQALRRRLVSLMDAIQKVTPEAIRVERVDH